MQPLRARATVGRLAVRGPTGCRYLDDPRQTDYVRDGWNLTGDAYSMDEDGYFWFQARTDDMIISSGYNISGPEVEAALLEHPAVAECAVVAAPDEERGHVVKAYVVASGDRSTRRGRCRTTSRRGSRRTSTRAASSSSTRCRARRPASCSATPAGAVCMRHPAAARLAAAERLRQRHRRRGQAGVRRRPDRLDATGACAADDLAGQFRQALREHRRRAGRGRRRPRAHRAPDLVRHLAATSTSPRQRRSAPPTAR